MNILIVGAGLFGVTIARLLTNEGHVCTIIDQRNHIGGNCYDEPYSIDNHTMTVHKYGPHVFHTSNQQVWNFVNKYAKFNNFRTNILAKDDNNKLYHLPFNMNTFYDIFGISNIEKVKNIIQQEIKDANITKITNLEEKAISMVGTTVYNTLIKNYTEKQWNCKCTELSPDIISRLPLRFYFDNNYFNDIYQGVPIGGYTKLIENIINGVDNEKPIKYILNTKFDLSMYDNYDNIIYCGSVDELLNYKFGYLEYRSLKFENTEYIFDFVNSNGCAHINLVGTQRGTREIEHIYYTPESLEYFIGQKLIKTLEVPDDWDLTKERFYSINNDKNNDLYEKYVNYLEKTYPNIILGGRLGLYKYLDMDDVILIAFNINNIINM